MDRTRRLRQTVALRNMVRENHVRVDELIYPLFVMEGENLAEPVESMPGICQYSLDRMNEELDRVKEAGIPAILIFGIPAHKDEVGSGAYDEHGIVQEAIRRIKKDYPELIVIADVCLCEYTSHGHCGLIKDGVILNDETLPLLAKSAVSYAEAGADIVAPSDMMDKRVEQVAEGIELSTFNLIEKVTVPDSSKERISQSDVISPNDSVWVAAAVISYEKYHEESMGNLQNTYRRQTCKAFTGFKNGLG